jgi:hypothetical protein
MPPALPARETGARQFCLDSSILIVVHASSVQGLGGRTDIVENHPPARQPRRLPHKFGLNVDGPLWCTLPACRGWVVIVVP